MRIPLEKSSIALGEKLINYEIVDTNVMGLYLHVYTDAKEDEEYIVLNDYFVNKYFQYDVDYYIHYYSNYDYAKYYRDNYPDSKFDKKTEAIVNMYIDVIMKFKKNKDGIKELIRVDDNCDTIRTLKDYYGPEDQKPIISPQEFMRRRKYKS